MIDGLLSDREADQWEILVLRKRLADAMKDLEYATEIINLLKLQLSVEGRHEPPAPVPVLKKKRGRHPKVVPLSLCRRPGCLVRCATIYCSARCSRLHYGVLARAYRAKELSCDVRPSS